MSLRSARLTTMSSLVFLALAGLSPRANAADERRALTMDEMNRTAAQSQSAELRALEESKRLEAIDRLKQLLADGADGDRKAEMMLRLAELYFEQGRSIYGREMETFEAAYDACFNTDGCDVTTMQADTSESATWYKKSIKLYENILQNYARYARADQATYFLGLAYEETKDREQASEAYKKLVKLYPESQYVPDAYVLLGEYFFDKNDVYNALRAYLKATAYRDSDRYGFALYKLGWCYFNVGEQGKAIDTMKAVVSYAMETSSQTGSKMQLEDEALRDLVRFFADAGEMDEAIEYLTKLGKKDLIRTFLQRLATLYFEQGKYDQSVDTYRRLILEDPKHKECPSYQNEIIQAYRKMAQKDQVLAEIDRLRREYSKSSAWARANAAYPDALTSAVETIEKALRKTAIEYHEEARLLDKAKHQRATETFSLAEQAYRVYLEEFPESKEGYDVRYAFGELLYKQKKFDEAFDQYLRVVSIDPKGQHSRFCAESAIYSAAEMVRKEGGGKLPQIDPKVNKEPQPLTDWEGRLVAASNKYAELYPDDDKIRGIIYDTASLLYNKYRFAESAELLRRVIAMDPGAKEAEESAQLILDSFTVRQDWEQLKINSKFFYDQKGLGSAKFKKDMYEIYMQSSFKVIETTFEKDKDTSKAGDGFVKFYEEFPDSPVAAQALNNASVYYHQSKRVGDAMRIRHILVEDERFGAKTKYYYDQIGALGYDYEQVADFPKASTYYEKLVELFPKEKEKLEKEKAEGYQDKVTKYAAQAADALYTAAVFRNAMGEWQTSIANYQRFITLFPTDARVPEMKLTIAKMYEDHESWRDAEKAYTAFYTTPAGASNDLVYYARLHAGFCMQKVNELTRANKLFEETIKLFEKDKASASQGMTEVAAQMKYILLLPKFESYAALKIVGAGRGSSQAAEDKSLKDSLTRKTQALVKVEEQLADLITTGSGEWGLAGAVLLGRLYENFGETMKNAPIPHYLNEEAKEFYVMGIEDQVFRQNQKAIEAYQLAVERAYEITMYNENTAFANRRLGELAPQDFPGQTEDILKPTWRSTTTRAFEPETSLK